MFQCRLNWIVLIALSILVTLAGCARGDGLKQVGAFKGEYWDNYFYDLELDGDRAYLTDNYGAAVVDLSDPADPRLIARLETGGACFCATAHEEILYAGAGKGLLIADLSTAASPKIIGDYALAKEPYDLKLEFPLLYIADNQGSVSIVDISDPSSPVAVAQIPTPGPCRSVSLDGSILYVADLAEGLRVYDVSAVGAPEYLSTLAGTAGAVSVRANGGILQVHIAEAGVILFDVTSPGQPVKLGEITPEYRGNEFIPARSANPGPADAGSSAAKGNPAVEAQLLAVRNGRQGVSVWRIDNKLDPRPVGYYAISGGCHGKSSRGELAYVAMDKLYILAPVD